MFALPYSAQARSDLPFEPSHSWLLGETRTLGLGWALAVAATFAIAAVAYLADASWWPRATMTAASLSIGLLVVFANRWWTVGLLISAALIAVAWRAEMVR